MTTLRFAPLIRVSTESQKKKKESLLTQKKQILEYVNILKGTIPENCWIYSGQEHATPKYERQKLNQLLEDSSQDLFDAVIAVDATRWSRDNHKSKEGLEILRSNNIKFFVGSMEYNLFNPEQIFFLSMAVEVGELQANLGTLKSITTRINKAKRGEPATRLPIGRTWSKENGWGIDKEISQKFTTIAKRFLTGEDLTKLGQIYGMSRNYLREILTKRCGDIWQQKFYAKKFNINEVIPIKIPQLIKDPKIIEAVKTKVQANKTVFHKQRKHDYLFGRMILCGHCGRALSGEYLNYKDRNYRHRGHTSKKGQRISVNCDHFRYVSADLIEEPIMSHVFEMFGDPVKTEQAIKDAIPNLDEVNEIVSILEEYKKEKRKIEFKVERLVDSIEDGEVKAIKDRIKQHENRLLILNNEIAVFKKKIESIPTEQDIRYKASIFKRMIKGYYRHSQVHYSKMTFDDKRKLLQHIFSGTDPDGNRCGIYIKKDDHGWLYEIRGNVMSEMGRLSDKIKIVNRP